MTRQVVVTTSICCRIFWLIFVIVAIYLSCKTSKSLYDKYENAPIQIKYEDVTNGLENVPFPAITFNNELQYGMYYYTVMNAAARYGRPFASVIKALEDDRLVLTFSITFVTWLFMHE
jgi:hypothetical protein